MKKILLSLVTLFAATTSAFAGDIITNGGFESWTDGACDGWKSTTTASSATLSQSTDAHSGSYSVKVAGITSGNKRLGSMEYTLKPGTYIMKAYVKGTGTVQIGYVPLTPIATGKYEVGNYEYNATKYAVSEDTWTEVRDTLTLTEVTTVNFVLMNPKNTGDKLVDDFSVETEDGGITDAPVIVIPEAEGDGTLENPYNSVAANNVASALESGAETEGTVYIKGKVAKINTAYNTSYKNISFTISPDGTAKGGFYCFRVSSDENPNLQLGDEVVVNAKLTNYKGNTPETVAGGTIYSINGTLTGISTISTSANKAQTIYSIDGRRLTKAERGVNIINGKKVIVL